MAKRKLFLEERTEKSAKYEEVEINVNIIFNILLVPLSEDKYLLYSKNQKQFSGLCFKPISNMCLENRN